MEQCLSLITLGVSDVAVLAEAAGGGATIARPGAQTFWGGYSGNFIDPDGHPWEVAHNPGWVLDGDGSVRLH